MKKTSFFRFRFVGGALTLAGLFIFIWMIQLLNNDEARKLVEEGQRIQTSTEIVMPARGMIYDRWGHVLAGNVEVYEIYADTRHVNDQDTIATTLSTVLGVKRSEILARFEPEPNEQGFTPFYVKLAEFITSEQLDQITAVEEELQKEAETKRWRKDEIPPNLDGLYYTAHMRRTYPEGTLAANVIGFYNFLERDVNKATGVFGVEGQYNRLLTGTPVKREITTDPHLMTENESEMIPPGASLVLTIDRDIQAMAEQAADRAMESTGSKSATILIMDPETGDIMAMAVTPRMDANEYWTYQDVFPGITPYNRAIGLTYEPGSIFKVLTMAAALDSGTVEPSTPFLDTGIYYIGGVGIHNWDYGAWGPQDMVGCMQHSLNVCLAWVADQMGPSVFYNYLEKFGIGHTTGVDLAGEVSSPLSVQGDTNWYPINLGTNSFGQGLAVSPLQVVSAIAAVANDGKMMMPRVLKAVIENGEEYSNPPQVISTPISENTADTLTQMLYTSLKEESSAALVEGYSVAGKTGTASIPGEGGYLSNATNASFIGWGPVEDPKFVVYVWLEQPASSDWGSVVAAPVFSQVVSELVVLMDLPPDNIREQMAGN